MGAARDMIPRRLKRTYWRLRAILRHPKSELYLPTRKAMTKVLACLHPGLWNQLRLRRFGIVAIPHAALRYRVHGNDDLYGFLNTGRRCSEDVLSAVEKSGRRFASFRSVLDFGCGCGLTLVWFADHSRSLELHGTDIDTEGISWCQSHYTFGSFLVNDALPPLTYPDKKFDLIYAISVFTHINEEQQFCWLTEFKRLLADDGILLITLHGEHVWSELPPLLNAKLKQSGILFVSDGIWKGIFPDWYQTTYHTKEYVRDKYSRYFTVVKYIPRGMNRHQDVVVLQNQG